MLAEYKRRRDQVLAWLAEEPRFAARSRRARSICSRRSASSCRRTACRTSLEFADGLLRDEHVVTTAGEAFDAPGLHPPLVRDVARAPPRGRHAADSVRPAVRSELFHRLPAVPSADGQSAALWHLNVETCDSSDPSRPPPRHRRRRVRPDRRRVARGVRHGCAQARRTSRMSSCCRPTRREIAAIARLCHETRTPLVPRGGGTGYTGGAVPVHGGVVLSLERLNRILEIDEGNLLAVVEPNVDHRRSAGRGRSASACSIRRIRRACGSRSIGGNVAECAGGPRAFKYGVTQQYVLGLEAVLPTGEVIRTGGKVVKNVVGYDLTQLLVGSEGTLAILTKIILRLDSEAAGQATLRATFPSVAARGRRRDAAHSRARRSGDARADRRRFARRGRRVSRRPFARAGRHRRAAADRGGRPAGAGRRRGRSRRARVPRGGRDGGPARARRGRAPGALARPARDLAVAADDLAAQDQPRRRRAQGASPRAVRRSSTSSKARFGLRDSVLRPRRRRQHPRQHHGARRATPPSRPARRRPSGRCSRASSRSRDRSAASTASASPRRRILGLELSPETIALMKRVKQAFDPHGILNPARSFRLRACDSRACPTMPVIARHRGVAQIADKFGNKALRAFRHAAATSVVPINPHEKKIEGEHGLSRACSTTRGRSTRPRCTFRRTSACGHGRAGQERRSRQSGSIPGADDPEVIGAAQALGLEPIVALLDSSALARSPGDY